MTARPPVSAWIAGLIVGLFAPFAGLACFMAGGYCCSGVTDPTSHSIAALILFPFRLLPVSDPWAGMVVVGAFWGALALGAAWLLSHFLPRRGP